MKPGWITQVRIDNSAMVTPLDDLMRERRLRTWPKNVTKTVTNDSSMVFANRANRIDAVSGVIFPPEYIDRPHLGWIKPTMSHIPEKTVEYIESIKMDIASQLLREECISCEAGQACPCINSEIVSTSFDPKFGELTYIIVFIIIIRRGWSNGSLIS